MIRGLPTVTEKPQLELENLGFKVLRVARMTNKPTRLPMPLYLINLLPSPKLNEITEIKNICGFDVTIENLKGRSYDQCYNCQKFGPSSENCNFQTVCLKCGGDHKPSNCPLTRDQPAICCRCENNHPANYRKCPAAPHNRGKNTPEN